MTLGSLPTNDVSPQADSSSADDADLEEQFLVKFQLQVQSSQESYAARVIGAEHICIYFIICMAVQKVTMQPLSEYFANTPFLCLQIHFSDFLRWLESFECRIGMTNFGIYLWYP